MGTFHQRKFSGWSFDYFSMVRSRKMKEWNSLVLEYISTKFVGCMSSDHVITSRDI